MLETMFAVEVYNEEGEVIWSTETTRRPLDSDRFPTWFGRLCSVIFCQRILAPGNMPPAGTIHCGSYSWEDGWHGTRKATWDGETLVHGEGTDHMMTAKPLVYESVEEFKAAQKQMGWD